MRILAFASTLFAVLAIEAKAQTNEEDEDSYTFHISLKAVREIQNQFIELKHSFEAADIDPLNYYCESQWNLDVVNKVTSAPNLVVKIFKFQNLCENNGIYDTEMFCFDI